MTTIDRIRVPWSGGRGGAGVSTFYALDASTALAPIRTFFNAFKALVPTPISWTFPGSGDTVVVETGVLSGSWAATGEALVAASGANTGVSGPVGAVINWDTGAVLFGHRVRGRTYIVPVIQEVHLDGSLNDSVITQFQGYAATLIAAVPGNLVVWSRPFAGSPMWTDVQGRTHPARASHPGAMAAINAATVPDLSAVLRSRRS